MTLEETERITGVAVSFAVTKVKLTGGEPMMRGDILENVEAVSDMNWIPEVSMTTDDTFLCDLAESIETASLSKVDVSLSTLNPRTYETIADADALEKTVSRMRKTVENGLKPVKVYMVLLKGINDHEVWSMMGFAERNNVILRLLDLESAREDRSYRKHRFDITGIEKELERKAEKAIVRNMHYRRGSKRSLRWICE